MARKPEVREKILELLKEKGELATPEVANAMGFTVPQAKHYLEALAIEGKITCRRVGARLLMWSIAKADQ